MLILNLELKKGETVVYLVDANGVAYIDVAGANSTSNVPATLPTGIVAAFQRVVRHDTKMKVVTSESIIDDNGTNYAPILVE